MHFRLFHFSPETVTRNAAQRLTKAGVKAIALPMADPANVEATDISAMSFEDALRSLEDVVRRLESGDVPLDQSIELYERGEQLRVHCQTRLDAAQARIEQIVRGADGSVTGTRPFDEPAR